MPPYSPEALRRWPDLEARELFASDAADRLILDESAAARRDTPSGTLVVIGDTYGALTLGIARMPGPPASASIRICSPVSALSKPTPGPRG